MEIDTFVKKIHLEFFTIFDFDNVKRSVLVYFSALRQHPIWFAGKQIPGCCKREVV